MGIPQAVSQSPNVTGSDATLQLLAQSLFLRECQGGCTSCFSPFPALQ